MFNIIGNLRQYYFCVANVFKLRSGTIAYEPRAVLFSIFKTHYGRYKSWIEPKGISQVPIDVIIPLIEKDLETLPHVIKAVRQHVKHPIKDIYIVAPESPTIELVAQQNGCQYVNEQDICSISKQQIGFVFNGTDRSGWIYQQLLKLSFDKLGTQEHHLVVDADTIFVKDTVFESNGKYYFDFSNEYHTPYYQAYEYLTGRKHMAQVSFVAHYMFFEKAMLRELKQTIEKTTGKSVMDAIIDLKKTAVSKSNFSEYETYANYCLATAPRKYRIRYWFNESYKTDSDLNRKPLEKNTRSVSFHAYNK